MKACRLSERILGEERYLTLKAMSDQIRALFEADPDDKTGDTRAGHMLIQEMEDILTSVAKREASKYFCGAISPTRWQDDPYGARDAEAGSLASARSDIPEEQGLSHRSGCANSLPSSSRPKCRFRN